MNSLKNGFSLIELLVVISIVAALLAITLPTISSAREQARRALCGSNIRQIFIGAEVYANDQREWYPYKGSATHAHYAAIKPKFRQQYLNDSNRLLYCPSATYRYNSLNKESDAARNEGYMGYWYLGGQGNSLTSSGQPQFPPEQWAQRSSENNRRIIPTVSRSAAEKSGNPDRRPLFLDAAAAGTTGDASGYSRQEQASYPAYPNRNHSVLQTNGTYKTVFYNIIFVDGAMRSYGEPELYPLRWTNSYNGNLHFP